MDLEDKIAIITGAGGLGTGRATTRRFARAGALVVVNDVNEAGGRETAALIESAGGRAAFCQADIGSESGVENLIDFAGSTFGGVDVLVNNASSDKGLGQFTGWIECMQTEVLGPMRAILATTEVMRQRGGGAVVNVGSSSALGHGRGHSPWPSYDTAKIAMMRLSTTLAPLHDEANIRVNCIVPGWISSPGPKEYWESLTPEQRKERGVPETLISPEEMADAIFRLATDEELFGRVMLLWNGESPLLIATGDRGYERLEPISEVRP
jgi:NAD(P)-dependent dehydrogenase (short-subunit alcohol dehydrogenase family)